MSSRSLLTRFRCSAHGVAATEFALVLPFLASIALLLPDLSQAAVGVIQMQGAARAGIQYAMAGGTSLTEAQTLGLQAWNDQPTDANSRRPRTASARGLGPPAASLAATVALPRNISASRPPVMWAAHSSASRIP